MTFLDPAREHHFLGILGGGVGAPSEEIQELTLLLVGQSNAEGRGATVDAPPVVHTGIITPSTYPYDADTAPGNEVGPAIMFADQLIDALAGRIEFGTIRILSTATGGQTVTELFGTSGGDGEYAVQRDAVVLGDCDEPGTLAPRGGVGVILHLQGENDANPSDLTADPTNWSALTQDWLDHIINEDFPGIDWKWIGFAQLSPSMPSGIYTDWATVRTQQAALEDEAATPPRSIVPYIDDDRQPGDLIHIRTGTTTANGWRRWVPAAVTKCVAAVSSWSPSPMPTPVPLTLSPLRWFEGDRNCAPALWEDQTGAADLGNTTPASQPQRIESDPDFNGLPSLSFDPADNDSLVEPAVGGDLNVLHDGTGGTAAFLVRTAGNGTQQTLFTSMGPFSGANVGLFIRYDASAETFRIGVGRDTGALLIDETISATLNTTGILVFRYDESQSPKYDIRWTGASLASGSPSLSPVATNHTQPARVGRNPSSTTQDWEGKLYALGVFPWLSDADVGALESYLTTKAIP
ncbi:MAG: hypothetical protein AAGE52_01320 [Myxococcota bacterium]